MDTLAPEIPPDRHWPTPCACSPSTRSKQAKSGHPGTPMGMADIAEVLWNRHLHHNPANPHWADRDRFVLSNGHGSMLLYALLHLTGYDLPHATSCKRFRQLHSPHARPSRSGRHARAWRPPPARWARASPTPWAWRWPRSCWPPSSTGSWAHHRRSSHLRLPRRRLPDGRRSATKPARSPVRCGLHKLIALYDDNGISIDGHVQGWFTDDTPERFDAYGWHVIAPGGRPRPAGGGRCAARRPGPGAGLGAHARR